MRDSAHVELAQDEPTHADPAHVEPEPAPMCETIRPNSCMSPHAEPIGPSIERAAPAPTPMCEIYRPKSNQRRMLPPIIRLVSAKRDKVDTSDDSVESLELGFEYFSSEKSSNAQAVVGTDMSAIRAHHRSMWDSLQSKEKHEFVVAAKKSKDLSLDIAAANDSAPTLQEYPADYETILIDFT